MSMSLHALAQKEIVLTGVFKGEPLYIQNSYHPGLKQFCIDEILVNGKSLHVNYNLSAIKIDFSGFDLYTPVKIKIDHKSVCKPTIINEKAILIHSSFKFTDLVINDSIMYWTTKGDRPGAVFDIEQLYADGWNVVGNVQSTGKFEGDRYEFFPPLTEGANKLRVKYKVTELRYLYSSEIELEYYPEPVKLVSTTVAKTLRFNRPSEYTIEDESGNIVLDGNGLAIDISALKAGEYFVYFGDEAPVRFLKNTK